jgi:type III secretion protein S
MALEQFATYVQQALLLVLWLSLPAVLAAGIVGLGVAFLQGITQVQDQTISFAIKLVAAVGAIALTSAWLGGELLSFAQRMFDAIPNVR